MKSTPEQTAKRRELKELVDLLGNLAWERNPEIASCAIISRKNSESREGVIDYDEFFVFEKETTVFPAKATNGKIFLRFRRRVTKDRKHQALWDFWEQGYAATKPEAVDDYFGSAMSSSRSNTRRTSSKDSDILPFGKRTWLRPWTLLNSSQPSSSKRIARSMPLGHPEASPPSETHLDWLRNTRAASMNPPLAHPPHEHSRRI